MYSGVVRMALSLCFLEALHLRVSVNCTSNCHPPSPDYRRSTLCPVDSDTCRTDKRLKEKPTPLRNSITSCSRVLSKQVNIHQLHTHTRTHTYIHTHTHASLHTHMHTYIHTYTCMHTYIHTYIHIYIHACTYPHAHTHTITVEYRDCRLHYYYYYYYYYY